MTISLDTLPYECPFYGTPRKFKSLATAYVTDNHIKGDRKRAISFGFPRLFGNRNYDPKQDDEHVGIDFHYNGAEGGAAECRIVVESQPTRPDFPPARLRVTMRAGEWALLRDVVMPFLDHLRAEGFLDEVQPGGEQPPTPTAAKTEAHQSALIPDRPPMPGNDAYTWDDVFDWYYRAPRHFCPQVDDLANFTGYAKRTIERYKSEYDAQYGGKPLPDDKSKFA